MAKFVRIEKVSHLRIFTHLIKIRKFMISCCVFVYDLFISEPKSQVLYGILHNVFFKRGIKGHRYCLSTVFPLRIVSFSHQ